MFLCVLHTGLLYPWYVIIIPMFNAHPYFSLKNLGKNAHYTLQNGNFSSVDPGSSSETRGTRTGDSARLRGSVEPLKCSEVISNSAYHRKRKIALRFICLAASLFLQTVHSKGQGAFSVPSPGPGRQQVCSGHSKQTGQLRSKC